MAIEQLVHIAPSVAWTASNLGISLNNQRQGIAEMTRTCCVSRTLNMAGLEKIAKIEKLESVTDTDTLIDEVNLMSDGTVQLVVFVRQRRPDTVV